MWMCECKWVRGRLRETERERERERETKKYIREQSLKKEKLR